MDSAGERTAGAGLLSALSDLRDRVARVPLVLEVAGTAAARGRQAGVVAQIDDYLLPRLRRLDAPLLAVVGGSTGAGKSTLVNSVVGAHVTTPGVLRPTTRAPILVANPEDRRWFADDRILPGLARTTGDAAESPGTLRVLTTAQVPRGLALLDAPDIDSVVAANRELAAQLLAAADLWVFVTTAARYADAVPWDLLHAAEDRSTALAVVLNRTPADAVVEVGEHLREMLWENGLGRAMLFTVPETPLVDGDIPDREVAPLRAWLHELAADAEQRGAVVRTTLIGALDSLGQRVPPIADHAETQAAAAAALSGATAQAYAVAVKDIEDGVRSGSLLRGEVLARWQEFVGTGELMRSMERQIGLLRDRLKAVFTGQPTPDASIRDALETGVEALVLDAADSAAERTVDTWRVTPAGSALIGGDARELAHASTQLRERLGGEIRAWQSYVLELVAEEGREKRMAARVASLGVNGAGLALMIAVFAQTGGLSGGEVVIAGGTSALGQRLLEAVFGDQAVRTLAGQARRDLMRRVEVLLQDEQVRFARRLTGVATAADAAALRVALADLRAEQRAATLAGVV